MEDKNLNGSSLDNQAIRGLGQYPIGVVSRLTGIAAGTLRMWERRYAVAEPQRGEKQNRQYSQADVERLTLMKKLVDRGHAPSTVAKLSTADMESLLDSTQVLSVRQQKVPAAARCVTVGERFSAARGGKLPSIQVARSYDNLEDFRKDKDPAKADIVLMEVASVQPQTADMLSERMQACGASGGVVLFRIATNNTLRLMEDMGVVCLRDPVTDKQMAQAIGSVCGVGPDKLLDQATADRMFSSEQLHQLASMSPAIKCECPQHLADLITSLNAFEKYSEECILSHPNDAQIHEDLRVSSGRSRLVLEQALKRLIEAENITLD